MNGWIDDILYLLMIFEVKRGKKNFFGSAASPKRVKLAICVKLVSFCVKEKFVLRDMILRAGALE